MMRSIYPKKILGKHPIFNLLLSSGLLLGLCGTANAQVTLISPTGDGGFENGSTYTANGWTIVNGSSTTRVWQLGTGQAGYSGTAAAFIGNSATNVGSATGSRTVHFYRSVTIPAGATDITLSYKYKQAVADSTYDYLKVFLNANVPVSGTGQTTGQVSIVNPGTNTSYSSFTTVTSILPNSYAGTTNNLIFTFYADNIAPHGYGAVDDISLVYTVPACAAPSGITAIASGASGGSVSWTAPASAPASYDLYYSTSGTAPTASTTLDASNSFTGITATSQAIGGLTPGTQYYVWVRSNCGANGFSVWSPVSFITQPANDDVANALLLTGINSDYSCASVTAASTMGATASSPAPSCRPTGANDDIWFKFQATGPAHRITLINTSGTSDMNMVVYSDMGTTEVTGGGTCANISTMNLTGLTTGQMYYVRVFTYSASATVTSNFNICIGTPPPPPANDELCNAITLAPAASCSYATYSNLSATGSTGIPAPGCASYSGGDVWFKVQVPASGHLKFNTQSGGITDGGMALYSSSDNTCSGTLTLIECDDDDSPNAGMPLIERYDFVPGATVFARFWAYDNAEAGNFGICVTSIACPIPTSVAAGSITATSASITWTGFGAAYIVEYGPSGFTPGTGANPGTGGIIAAGTTSPVPISGLTPATNYQVYVRQNCSGSGYSANSSAASFTTLGLPPANDDPASATTLSLGTACATTYSNLNATLATAEPRISCKGSQTAAAQVWFKFVAPASGFVRITTDYASTSLDTKIGLFGTSNPSDPTDMASFFIISCDDDGGVTTSSASTIYASGLTEGTTYYVAVAHYNNASSGNFCIDVKEVTSAMLATTGSCASVQSLSTYLASYTGWISLIDNNGNLVANVKQNAGTATDFSGAFTVSAANRTAANGNAYLRRNYLISGSGVTSADLKLYFTDAEVAALGSPLSSLNVSRVPGTTCTPNFTGTATALNQTASGSANGISWINVTTPGFSNFFIMSGTTPLPVDLLRFSGKNEGTANLLSWETATEKNFSHFELERSADGVRFGRLGVIAGQQHAEGGSYSYADERPLEGKNRYRLKMVDLDGNISVSEVIEVQARSGSGLSLSIFPNPADQLLSIDIIGKAEGKATIQLLDIVGKVLQTLPVNGSHIEIGMQHLPAGSYMVRYIDNSHQSVVKVSKH